MAVTGGAVLVLRLASTPPPPAPDPSPLTGRLVLLRRLGRRSGGISAPNELYCGGKSTISSSLYSPSSSSSPSTLPASSCTRNLVGAFGAKAVFCLSITAIALLLTAAVEAAPAPPAAPTEDAGPCPSIVLISPLRGRVEEDVRPYGSNSPSLVSPGGRTYGTGS